jgi:hypothetical protein
VECHAAEPLMAASTSLLTDDLRRTVEEHMREQQQLIAAMREFDQMLARGADSENLLCSPNFREVLARLRASQNQQRELLSSEGSDSISHAYPQLLQQSRTLLQLLSQVTVERPRPAPAHWQGGQHAAAPSYASQPRTSRDPFGTMPGVA